MSAEDVVPNSAMDTGSDDGEPGDRAPYEPLAESDLAILEALRSPAPGGGAAVEDTPEVLAAVRDDAPLPPGSADREPASVPDDGLAPLFREPD